MLQQGNLLFSIFELTFSSACLNGSVVSGQFAGIPTPCTSLDKTILIVGHMDASICKNQCTSAPFWLQPFWVQTSLTQLPAT
jgi:hypothetical protein